MKEHVASLDAIFGALADATRRSMLQRLTHGPCSIGILSEPFEMSAPAISKHLRVLEQSGLITRTKRGRITVCRLTQEPFGDARRWLDEHETFWAQQFDSLERFLEEGSWPPSPGRETSRSGSRAASRRLASKSSTPGRRPKR